MSGELGTTRTKEELSVPVIRFQEYRSQSQWYYEQLTTLQNQRIHSVDIFHEQREGEPYMNLPRNEDRNEDLMVRIPKSEYNRIARFVTDVFGTLPEDVFEPQNIPYSRSSFAGLMAASYLKTQEYGKKADDEMYIRLINSLLRYKYSFGDSGINTNSVAESMFYMFDSENLVDPRGYLASMAFKLIYATMPIKAHISIPESMAIDHFQQNFDAYLRFSKMS